jgi:hypothetical protein
MWPLYVLLWSAAAIAAQNDIATPKQEVSHDNLSAAYAAAIYGIEPAQDGGYEAWNARQKLTAHFRPDGLRVESAYGFLELQLVGWGEAEAVLRGRRIEYQRGSMVEWYRNGAAGIEQGFTFFRRPASARALTIALAVRGSWRPELSDQGRSILFRSKGKRELRYTGLKAWDAHGRDLPAHMVIAGGEVRILVDDAGAVYPVIVDPVLQQAKLTGFDGAVSDNFAASLSVSGDTAVAGALGKNGNTGAAYVFVRSGTDWTQQAKLTASDAAMSDQFGVSVSVSGDTLVVGANNKSSATGAAYVFVRSGTSWTQQAILTASDGATNDAFGRRVSVTGDTVVAGAYGRNGFTGAAYVFVRGGTTWSQQAILTAADAASGDHFGNSVSVTGDTIVAGAYGKNGNTGAVYVFLRSGITWTQQTKLSASDGVSLDFFGVSVSVSGDTAVAGAYQNSSIGAAYVFVRSGTTWTQQAKLTAADGAGGDNFGYSVSVSGDILAAGAWGRNNNTGAAYIYVRSGTNWTQRAILSAPDAAFADQFGLSVSLSGDTVVTGANAKNNSTGAAYVFSVQVFSDVSPSEYYFDAVNLMSAKGITAGCGSGQYCPTENVTRAQMAIFIVRAIEGGDNFTFAATPWFTDVQSADFGFKWIQKMKELGITAGCGNNRYCPESPVTRDEMAIFIIRARLGVNLAGANPSFVYPATPFFTDEPGSDFGFPWVQRMKLESITAGCGANIYCPGNPVTRGDMAIFIMRGAFNRLLPPGTPVLTQINPGTLTQGTTATFTVTGASTNFVQGTTVLSPLPGVTIGTVTVTSPTTLTVQLTAASDAAPQPYSVLAITGAEQAVLPNGLVIQ